MINTQTIQEFINNPNSLGVTKKEEMRKILVKDNLNNYNFSYPENEDKKNFWHFVFNSPNHLENLLETLNNTHVSMFYKLQRNLGTLSFDPDKTHSIYDYIGDSQTLNLSLEQNIFLNFIQSPEIKKMINTTTDEWVEYWGNTLPKDVKNKIEVEVFKELALPKSLKEIYNIYEKVSQFYQGYSTTVGKVNLYILSKISHLVNQSYENKLIDSKHRDFVQVEQLENLPYSITDLIYSTRGHFSSTKNAIIPKVDSYMEMGAVYIENQKVLDTMRNNKVLAEREQLLANLLSKEVKVEKRISKL